MVPSSIEKTKTCKHIDQIKEDIEPKTPDGCEECLKTGDDWVHLRKCMTCGHIGCCNSSKNKHAQKHFEETKHPVIENFSLYADGPWRWCYVDEVYLD